MTNNCNDVFYIRLCRSVNSNQIKTSKKPMQKDFNLTDIINHIGMNVHVIAIEYRVLIEIYIGLYQSGIWRCKR
jgi:hypothetical protein